jgi:hypothetical protein
MEPSDVTPVASRATQREDRMPSKKHTTNGHAGAGRRSKSVINVIARYKHEPGMSRAERMAHFLNWAAKELPGVPIPVNLVLKAIMGYTKTPRLGGEEVELLRGQTSAARKLLKEKYGRGLHAERGLGIRATVGDEDMADTQYRKDMRRVVSAVAGANETHALITPSKIKDERLRNWVKGAGDQVKQLGLGDRLLKLLPPKPEDDDGGGGEGKK